MLIWLLDEVWNLCKILGTYDELIAMRSEIKKLGSMGDSGDPSPPPNPCSAVPRDTQAGQHQWMHTSQDPVAPFSRG